ncbi:SH3 domain-binding protein 5 homolog [Culicoides brevitarsis]|uniref:SH3 domain-binding protein 5 homolog n=1 Tax=Culicoides brevitarsis TaxID=469753 RepID=UPI00307B4967
MDDTDSGQVPEEQLDPRIQIELENLNTATDGINKLEIELEEANATFNILLNESTRRLKLLVKKLGSSIEKARPYHEAVEAARKAQIECQSAAVKYQRANEIHAAAKETVALAEQRFMSNSHEWQFDNAWQEMLNHATLKVMEAEKNKAETVAEHQRRAAVFSAAEKRVQELEDKYRGSINKSRRYFEEKQVCQDQLETQKGRIQQLQAQLQACKTAYATSLRNLEQISEDIHRQRGDLHEPPPPGPRQPGVGCDISEMTKSANRKINQTMNSSLLPQTLPDFTAELDKCEYPSTTNSTVASSAVSEKDPDEEDPDDLDLEELRQKVKTLAVRPVEGGDGQPTDTTNWEHELHTTVDKLDHLMMIRELSASQKNTSSLPNSPKHKASSTATLPSTPTNPALKRLEKADPLPLANVSMYMLPTSDVPSTQQQRRRKLSQ